MLKKVFVNCKKVPVPVPVRTLGEALTWIEQTLVPAGHTITRIALEDRVLAEDTDDALLAQALTAESKLEIQIDSPVDLAVQTLDAMRNLASVIMSGLKPLAVECWQARPTVRPTELDAVSNDLDLIQDLIEHISVLTEPMQIDAASIQANGNLMKRATVGLAMARSNSDWRAAAKILLNKLEPLLKDLVAEAESIQIRVMTQAHAGSDGIVRVRAPTG